MTPKPPLQPILDPDDYQCYASLLDQDGQPVQLVGMLSLQGDRPPSLHLHGEVPVEIDLNPVHGEGVVTYPQISRLATLKVDLVQGLDVVLLDCVVTKLPQRAIVDAAAALVGRPGSLPEAAPELLGARLQVTGLDAVLGLPPLGSFTIPTEPQPDQPFTWSVTERLEARSMSSADGGAEVGAYWHGSFSLGNAYQHRIRFSPVATVQLSEPVTLTDLVKNWATPLHRIVGLATNRTETITYLAARTAGSDQQRLDPQLFGSAISQQPYESDEAEVWKVQPAFYCYGEGNPTLLDLCRAWQRAQDDHHPLIETVGAFLLLPRLHPRPRYLLFIQALEGLHDHDHTEEITARDQAHRERRAEARKALDACTDLDPDTRKWIKDNLPRRPITSLDTALKAVIAALPAKDLVTKFQALDLVQQVIADPSTDASTWAAALRSVRNSLSHGSRGWDHHLLTPAADLLERCCRAHLMLLLGVPTPYVENYLTRQ